MRPTNEERREVAEKLRELAARNQGLLEQNRMGEVLAEAQKAMGTRGLASVAHVLERYADLIEPEERTGRATDRGVAFEGAVPLLECSECGGLDYARANGAPWRYCPNCGAKVVE